MSAHHKPRKRFGQHFLRDDYVLMRIVQAISPTESDHLVEIGPGEGVLTELLLPLCAQCDIVEIDVDLVQHLQNQFGQTAHLTIHQQDALTLDLKTLSPTQPLRIVGNLPYNISTPLLFHLFSQMTWIEDMHFLLQKEVVDRLTAPVNHKHYGRLSVMAQYYCQTEFVCPVPPEAFYPPPKVDSSVVRLTPRKQRDLTAQDITHFSALVKEAFTYRRKTLLNALKRFVSAETLLALGISPQKRPQELTVDDFIRISNALLVK